MGTEILAKPSRYQRFQQILDQAAGDSTADYDGLGRFWIKLPLTELLQVELHGVRLIAPEKPPTADCGCGNCAQAAGSRSSRSGLILGLRGKAPFDGSQFPRIPWGGLVVSDDDIETIAEWIDDGAPAGDDSLPAFEVVTGGVTVASEGYEVYTGSSNEYKYQRGEIRQRMDLDLMMPEQLAEFRCAFREVLELNKWPLDSRNYNNLALIHQNHCQHGWERFLPWHRVYLYEFEQALQDHCPGVAIPYWDWTLPQYPKLETIPPSFQLFLTDASLAYLHHEPGKIPARDITTIKKNLVDIAGGPKHFATQSAFFEEVARLIGAEYTTGDHRNRFIDALLDSNSLWYPLRYPGQFFNPQGGPSTIEDVIHYHFPSPQDMRDIRDLRTFRDFGGGSLYYDSFGFIDQNPHNTMHIWTGGFNPDSPANRPQIIEIALANRNKVAMNIGNRKFHKREDLYSQPSNGDMFSNLTASYDPIFWPIHSNVDRIWSEWQDDHPHALPVDLDAVLTPWSYTVRDTLDMHRFGYEYVKSSYMIPVGTGAAVGRFVSKPIDVSALKDKVFRQAEVRLHRVPQLPRSCFIRVFLNLPDANAKTPLDHKNYAGYAAVFGHGACYGGPGHCDPPPRERRSYDIRPRSHNTPRNYRVNVTECAQRLLTAGATSLQITLVVIGADYIEDHELLRLDSVSLNFLD
jgi:tyrosinase